VSTAELLADGGAAAATEEFFRSPEFLRAEGATHTLRIEAEAGAIAAPLVVREIPEGGGLRDAISPYGYPGFDSPPGISLDPEAIDFGSTGLVTAFIRHRLGSPSALAGASERNVVQIADPELERKSRASDRQQIRRNEREGYRVEIVPGLEAGEAERAGFLQAYTQTMERTGAAERYFYGADYFDALLSSPRTALYLVRAPDGAVAAGSLVVESDGMLHYYLSGTATPHLRDSPMKSLVSRLVDAGEEQGKPVNFGGGIAPGDALEEFKRGFANRQEAWRTSEIVCDPVAYSELSAGREAAGFFPAYRAE